MSPTPREKLAASDSNSSKEIRQIEENIKAVHEFYSREERRRSTSQRLAETAGSFVGRPAFVVVIAVFVIVWISANYALIAADRLPFDEPPFFWMQGILGLAALLTTAFVLIKQNRVAKLSEQRDHLDLKMMMIIEQKTAKLIDLIEELRRDLPDVKDRLDASAADMRAAMSPERVLEALDEELIATDGTVSEPTDSVAPEKPEPSR